MSDEYGKWISVKDRLPDHTGDVLVYDGQFIYMAHLFDDRSGFDISGNYYSVNAITHWMPLPEPPKE